MKYFLICWLFPLFAEAQYFAVQGHYVWRWGDTLSRFDLRDPSAKPCLITVPSPVNAMTTDRNGTLFTAHEDRKVRRFLPDGQRWETVASLPDTALRILFDRRNRLFVITYAGIYEPASGEQYRFDSIKNPAFSLKPTWEYVLEAVFDPEGRIWMRFQSLTARKLLIFDPGSRAFARPGFSGIPFREEDVRSMTASGNALYLAAAGNGNPVSCGLLVVKKGKPALLFRNNTYRRNTRSQTPVLHVPADAHHFNVVGYNPFDESLLIDSHRDVYKGRLSDNLSRKKAWKPVVSAEPLHPNLPVPSEYSIAPYRVTDLVALDKTRLLVVTVMNGIGYFDGKRIHVLY